MEEREDREKERLECMMTQNQKELQLDEDKCTEPRKIENIQLKPVVDSFTKLEVRSTHLHAQKWDVVIYTYK